MSKIHELKCFPDRFENILSGACKADVRFNDKGYEEGDRVFLYEGYPDAYYNFVFTDRVLSAKITYVDRYAVQEGFVVLSLEVLV